MKKRKINRYRYEDGEEIVDPKDPWGFKQCGDLDEYNNRVRVKKEFMQAYYRGEL